MVGTALTCYKGTQYGPSEEGHVDLTMRVTLLAPIFAVFGLVTAAPINETAPQDFSVLSQDVYDSWKEYAHYAG